MNDESRTFSMQAARAHDDVDEEGLRAWPYRLLAGLLATPPDQPTLDMLRGLRGDGSEIGQALAALSRAADRSSITGARVEYEALFIGLGRGELIPYASHYLTGFLNEKPLALVRDDLAALGVSRAPRTVEPEDHVAALCEVMAGMIDGGLGEAPLERQRRFFDRHLRPWARRFFTDLEQAPSAVLYAPAGTLGRVFMDIETTAFSMLD